MESKEHATPSHDAANSADPDAVMPKDTPGQNQSQQSTDDVLHALSEFEEGLKGLKAIYNERQFQQAQLHQREVDCLMKEAELSQKSDELAELEAKVAKETSEIASLREQLEARAASIEERERQILQEREEIQKRKDTAEETARTLTELDRSMREEASSRQKAIEARAAEVEAKALHLETLLTEAESKQGEYATRMRELDALDVEIAKERAQNEARANALTDERRRLDEARADLSRREAALADSLAKIAAWEVESANLSKRLREAQDSARKSEANAALASGRINELERQLVATKESLAACESGRADGAEALRQRIERLGEVLEEYEQWWRIERDEVRALRGEASCQALRTAELEGVIEQLRERLNSEIDARRAIEEKHAAALAEAGESLAQARADRHVSGSAEGTESIHRRRNRLKKCRQLVKARHEKVKRAEEALARRYEQVEHLLSQRAQLAEAHKTVTHAQRRLQKQQATGRTAVVMLCTVVVVALLTILSWAVSRETFPGRYAAKSMMRADGRGKELNAAELSEWTSYVKDLVRDPRFADAVAKRMTRKGMETLSVPAAVAARMKADLSVESSKDGEVVLELRGEGKRRTERELETIATALAAEANAARASRADGTVTLPPTDADAGNTPIDDTQKIAAAIMLGSGLFVTLFVGAFLWKKLANAKTQFEQDSQLASVLDEASWADPRIESGPLASTRQPASQRQTQVQQTQAQPAQPQAPVKEQKSGSVKQPAKKRRAA